jgi:hydroxymethylbilane synthase
MTSLQGCNLTPTKLIIGTRGSELALYQANFIRDVLRRDHGCEVDVKIIKTVGDKLDTISFDKMEGKGFFTKELEEALLAGQIDLAVHSLKDLMTTQPDGLKLGAVGYRADRREMLLMRKDACTNDGVLPVTKGGVVGTSSNRRRCQIAQFNPSVTIMDLRGNIPTRLRRLREGQYDAIIIAASGVARLKLDVSDLEIRLLDPDEFLPAPAQGVLGMQIRANDDRVGNVVAKLGNAETAVEVSLERGLLKRFDSGCSLPLGVYSEVSGSELRLKAVLGRRGSDGWIGLTKADVTGANAEKIVDEAFAQLSTGL